MRIDIIKILQFVVPCIQVLCNEVPRRKRKLYLKNAKYADKVFDSLEELFYKIEVETIEDTRQKHIKNLTDGLTIAEQHISFYQKRLDNLKCKIKEL